MAGRDRAQEEKASTSRSQQRTPPVTDHFAGEVSDDVLDELFVRLEHNLQESARTCRLFVDDSPHEAAAAVLADGVEEHHPVQQVTCRARDDLFEEIDENILCGIVGDFEESLRRNRLTVSVDFDDDLDDEVLNDLADRVLFEESLQRGRVDPDNDTAVVAVNAAPDDVEQRHPSSMVDDRRQEDDVFVSLDEQQVDRFIEEVMEAVRRAVTPEVVAHGHSRQSSLSRGGDGDGEDDHVLSPVLFPRRAPANSPEVVAHVHPGQSPSHGGDGDGEDEHVLQSQVLFPRRSPAPGRRLPGPSGRR